MNNKSKLLIALIATLTLGLAPYSDPHILKQIQNIVHNRQMNEMDWFDILLHGAPWLFLSFLLIRRVYSFFKSTTIN